MNHDMIPPPEPPVMSRAASGRFDTVRTWAIERRRLLSITASLTMVVVALFFALRPTPKVEVRGGRFGGMGPMPVNVAKAEKGEIPIVVSALGTVTPLQTVTVRPQATGYITQILFKEGQLVKEGDLLAIIDPRPYQFALEQAQGQLARDQAQLRNAELDLERYQSLLAQESIAKQQVDTQAALVRQYRGVVQADTGLVDTARLNFDRAHVKAPLTGRVGLRVVDEGNYIANGDTNGIAVITQVQPISVLFTIPEDQLQAVIKQVRDGKTLPVTALDRSDKATVATGTLSTVDNRIDTATGTVKLRAVFDNTDESLFPNQFVNIDLLVDTLKDVTVVPVAAVQRGAPGTFVYVVNAENTVSVRPVTLGAQTPDRVMIAEGLAPDDVVVTDGADRISDGAQVLLPGQTPPPAGAPRVRGKRPDGQRGGDNQRRGPPRGGAPGGAHGPG